MTTVAAPSAPYAPRHGALPGACAIGLAAAAALVLAACQTGAPQNSHANRQDPGLPLLAAALVLHAGDALPNQPHAAPAAAATAPYVQAVAGPDPVDPTPPGDGPDDTPAIPVAPETTPHAIRLSQPRLHNPDAADLLDEWGHRPFARILDHRPLGVPPGDGDAERLTAILEAAQSPEGSSPIPGLQEGDEMTVLGGRRGITYGRWIAGAADTLSMSFDISNAGPEVERREGLPALLERAGKVWTSRIDDTWQPWKLEPGHVKLRIPTEDGPETPISVGPDGEISTGIEVQVATAHLPDRVAGRGGPVNRWPTDRWEPHFGRLTIDNQYLHSALEHRLHSTLAHEIGHILGSWYGEDYTHPYAPYSDLQTGHWTGPNVVALHGGPAPFQDHDNPFDSRDGQRDPAATQFDFAHSGVCASIMAYCRHSASAPVVLPAPIDFAFLADLGLSIRPETDRPETYGLVGWMHHASFAFSVSRDLQLDVAYPANNGNHRVSGTPALDVTDLLHAEALAFGHRSTGELLVSYPATQRFGPVRYTGALIGAAVDLPALPPVTGDAALSLDLDTLDGAASFTSLAVYSGGEPEPFAGGALHYPIEVEDNAIAATGTDATLSAAFFGPAHEEIAGTLHDPGEGLMASFGATHDKRPTADRILAGADHLTGVTTAPDPADSSQASRSQLRCTDILSCERRQLVAGDWSDWTPLTREHAASATAPNPDGRDGRPHRDLGHLRISRVLAPQDGDELQLPLDAAYLGTLTHGAFGIGLDPLSTVWTGAYGDLSGSVPEGPAQWTGLMLGYSHAEDHAQSPFVRGRATLDLDLANMELALAVSDVATADDLHNLPGFDFQEIALASDGTFHSDNQRIVAGALLGLDRKDAAGSFHHDEADVTGSFGAHAVPDTASLEDAGDLTIRGTVTDETGTYDFHFYEDWGIWAKQFDHQLFRAVIQQGTTVDGDITSYDRPRSALFGTPSETNPVSGSAVWNGEARAFRNGTWTPATAEARIEVDFAATTVDVDITDFDTDHPDLSWRDMRLLAGSFRHAAFDPTVEGSFYGTVHQGVAGTFRSDELQGIFGAVRNDTGSFADLAAPDTVKLLPTGEIERRGTATDDLRTWNYHSFRDWGGLGRSVRPPVVPRRRAARRYRRRELHHLSPTRNRGIRHPVRDQSCLRQRGLGRRSPRLPERNLDRSDRRGPHRGGFRRHDCRCRHHGFRHRPSRLVLRDMALSAGSFTDATFNPTIEGSFYGAAHQGAAGTFRSDRLQGVFGAVRDDGQ